jgi:hypothetical protein
VLEVEDVLDGVVDGALDGVEPLPPMFGQLPAMCVAVLESLATAAGVDVDLAAVLDELDAACATAPPASAAVAARVTASLR